ncbi:MAG: hypothetical protein J6A85_03230 [Clostridia bacterium]|nr:hypothetical protein [Clostridia bacterium]
MEHLKIDQIIEFVSMTDINTETLSLSSKVIGHVRECQTCSDTLKAYRLVYEELVRLGKEAEFSKIVKKEKALRELEK